ncbi:MAG: DUF1080 domain-containing protein [Planctomycetota bacterium]|nr:MAG: DUF1080 domain-containing protein [Planctomycetota bacterium]
MLRRLFCGLLLLCPLVVHAEDAKPAAAEGEWIPLFNGKDLTGWKPKIRFHEYGENYANTFRVEDGLLKVRYDGGYEEGFKETFGHLFHEKEFSHYVLRVEYRFVGEQCQGGPGWATRNSGMMLHGQTPESMSKDQDFPASIEVQILGGNGKDKRTTMNLCTPYTNVVRDGKLFLPHCVNSKSETYHGDQWIVTETEVNGHGFMRHKINGEVVLEYSEPQLDDREKIVKELAKTNGGLKLEKGTISLQSESHPIDFRKVEIKVLK